MVQGASSKPISKDVIIDLRLLVDDVLHLDNHGLIGLNGLSFCAERLAGFLCLEPQFVVVRYAFLEGGPKRIRTGLGNSSGDYLDSEG